MHYKVIRFLLIVLSRLVFRIEVRGREHFPPPGQPFIFASNHLSYFDPPILAVASPRRLCFLGKEELFQNALFRFLIVSLGTIPLKRGTNDIKATRTALKVLKDHALVVFPQGTRGAAYDQFNSGVGFLARKARVPIMAAHIYGADKILPPGAKLMRPVKLKVAVDRVRDIKETDSYQEIAAKVMARIKGLGET